MWAALRVSLLSVLLLWVPDTALAQVEVAPADPGPTPPGLHARLFESQFQQLREVCSRENAGVACMGEFWEAADVSGNGELSVAEITRVLRIVSAKIAHEEYVQAYEEFQFSPSKGRSKSPPESEEDMVVLGTAAAGPIVSHAIVANLDYNDNGTISKNEALHDIAVDMVMSSVDSLPSEFRIRASKAVEFLLQMLAQE